jgi:hypothetical protein
VIAVWVPSQESLYHDGNDRFEESSSPTLKKSQAGLGSLNSNSDHVQRFKND